MDGNRSRGRPKIDDPKMKIPSYFLRQSTIIEIEVLAEKLQKSRSELLQTVVENGLNILKILQNNKK